MPKIKANNITMNYEQQGTGDPLILIPYLTADHACYAFQVAEYAKHFTCISLDLRGTGETDNPGRCLLNGGSRRRRCCLHAGYRDTKGSYFWSFPRSRNRDVAGCQVPGYGHVPVAAQRLGENGRLHEDRDSRFSSNG